MLNQHPVLLAAQCNQLACPLSSCSVQLCRCVQVCAGRTSGAAAEWWCRHVAAKQLPCMHSLFRLCVGGQIEVLRHKMCVRVCACVGGLHAANLQARGSREVQELCNASDMSLLLRHQAN